MLKKPVNPSRFQTAPAFLELIVLYPKGHSCIIRGFFP